MALSPHSLYWAPTKQCIHDTATPRSEGNEAPLRDAVEARRRMLYASWYVEYRHGVYPLAAPYARIPLVGAGAESASQGWERNRIGPNLSEVAPNRVAKRWLNYGLSRRGS